MASFEDNYTLDTSKAQQGITGLSGKLDGLTDKIGGGAGKLGEMKGRIEGAADSVEVFKVALGSFIGENEAANAAIEGLSAGAQTVAAGFAFGGPIGAGIAAGALGIYKLAEAYSYTTAEAKKSVEQIRASTIELSAEERALQKITDEIAKMAEKKELNAEEEAQYIDLLKQEKTATDAVKTAADERAKAQAAIARAMEEEKAAFEELQKLRNAPTKEESERAAAIKQYLAENQDVQKRIADQLLATSRTAKEAKQSMDQILSGRGGMTIDMLANIQAGRGGIDPGLADIRALNQGYITPSEQAKRGFVGPAFVPPSQEQANAEAAFVEQSMAAQDLANQTRNDPTKALADRYMDLEKMRDEAKAQGDRILFNLINSLQDQIAREQARNAALQRMQNQKRSTFLNAF